MDSLISQHFKDKYEMYQENIQEIDLLEKDKARLTSRICSYSDLTKKKKKIRIALAFTLTLGIGFGITSYLVNRKIQTKHYFKTEKELVTEDTVIPLDSDYMPYLEDGKRVDIIEYEPWEEISNDKFLTFGEDFSPQYERDIVCYENVKFDENSDYSSIDLSEYEKKLIDTISTYIKPESDDVKRFIVNYYQDNYSDAIKVWESSNITGLFVILLIIDLFGTGYLSLHFVNRLINLSRDKKIYERLIQELNDLLINLKELNLSLEEVKLDLVNLFEKYGDNLQDENIRSVCFKLLREKSE